MRYRISKEFEFSASHILHGLPEGHPCGRLHGHNYRVRLVLEAQALDEKGFVLDYGELKPFKEMLDTQLDHRHLNDVLTEPAFTTDDGLAATHQVPLQPSAENIARWLGNWCRQKYPDWPLAEVHVSETPKTWAVWRMGL